MRNQDEARKCVSAVAQRLSDWDYWQHLQEEIVAQDEQPPVNPLRYFSKHPFKPESKRSGSLWSADGFRVAGTTSGEKDLTFQALGVGSQLQGIRSDRIVIDDCQDPSLAMTSPKDSADKLKWFQSVLLGRVSDEQQVVVMGNFFSPDDFLHRLIASPSGEQFRVVQYPA